MKSNEKEIGLNGMIERDGRKRSGKVRLNNYVIMETNFDFFALDPLQLDRVEAQKTVESVMGRVPKTYYNHGDN